MKPSENFYIFKEIAAILSPSMLTYDVIIHFITLEAQFLTGVLINGFIVTVNVMEFITKSQIAPLDLLITCLAISRLSQQMFAFLLPLALFSFIKLSVLHVTCIIVLFTSMWGLWLATWLSVFYCAKIATIPHTLFSWLKMQISKLVPWMILGSTLYAVISTGIHSNYMWTVTKIYMEEFLSSNETYTKRMDIEPFAIYFFHFIVPSTIFLITAMLLIISLGRHAWKMRTIGLGTVDSCCSAPLRAMVTVVSFLFLYLSYYTGTFLYFIEPSPNGMFFIPFFNLIGSSYPSIHSVTLIVGNAKLKRNAKKFLLCGLCGK